MAGTGIININKAWSSAARRAGGMLCGGAMMLLMGMSAAQAAADTVEYIDKAGTPTTAAGVIMKDDMKELSIGGKVIPRDRVVSVVYAEPSAPAWRKAMAAIDAGNYTAALTILTALQKRISRMSRGVQKPLFAQHIYYYKALCYSREPNHRGDSKARTEISKLLYRVKNTSWFFHAKMLNAQMKAAKDSGDGILAYGDLKKEFANLVNASPLAEPMIVACDLARLRLELAAKIRGGDKGDIKKLAEEMKAALDSEHGKKLQAEQRVPAVKVLVKAFNKLELWDDFLSVINGLIDAAVLRDDATTLKTYYVSRAEAYWGLYEEAKKAGDNAKVEGYLKRARSDYMRVEFIYKLGKEVAVRARYRVGRAFMELKDGKNKAWMKRAQAYLSRASRGRSPKKDVAAAEELLKEINELIAKEAKPE